jgi:peptidoglycan hydrolase-like protein with peptidoglycan-binding domain
MKTKAITFARGYMHKHLGHIVTFMSSAFSGACPCFRIHPVCFSTDNDSTATAGFGSTGANVTSIQTYLASNPSFYPQGLVTGYYGALTQAAVQRFQAFYGIVSSGSPSTTGYGRVGPRTLAKMNELIAGGTVTTGDVSAPYISGVTIATSSNSASFSWNTNELATGRVYYSTSPITFNEGNENSVGFAVTSGQSASFDTTTRLVHGAQLSTDSLLTLPTIT